MFRPLLVPVPPQGAARIEIVARALTLPAARPRPRWRNRLVSGEGLRAVRTSLQGRIPGTGEPVVGPFRPVLLHAGPAPLRRGVRSWLQGPDGIVEARLEGAGLQDRGATLQLGSIEVPFQATPHGLLARLVLPNPRLWFPHTHGPQPDYPLHATFQDGTRLSLGNQVFRTIERRPGDGLALAVNGVPVFCRGAIWSGHTSLHQAKAAGFNMVRIPATGAYPETLWDAQHLGMLVWQDFMFARFDYPATTAFLEEARAEARHVLTEFQHDNSLAVLCGGDEVFQAAAMAGRPPDEWSHPLFDDVLRQEAAALRPDLVYVPNAPSGGTPPFAASAPVAHYFGVGAYQRPLHEAAGIRFAAACLAFSNPPDAESCRALSPIPGDASWAATVSRDPGASWTFEDTRDHYAATLLGTDPATLRRTDPGRWLATGRAAIALAMQSAFTTWRTDPGCGGALVLELEDTQPGPGWGLVDHLGRPKSAWHALAQISAPLQVLLRDDGLDGIVAHVLNEGPDPFHGTLRLRGLTHSGQPEWLGTLDIALPPHGRASYPASTVMRRFVDLAGTWRFGPAQYRVLGAVLETAAGRHSQATLFFDPALPRERLGLTAALDGPALDIGTERFAQFVTIDAGPHQPSHDHVHLWPGESIRVTLAGQGPPAGTVTALNALDPAHFRART